MPEMLEMKRVTKSGGTYSNTGKERTIHVTSFLSITCLSNSEHWSQKIIEIIFEKLWSRRIKVWELNKKIDIVKHLKSKENKTTSSFFKCWPLTELFFLIFLNITHIYIIVSIEFSPLRSIDTNNGLYHQYWTQLGFEHMTFRSWGERATNSATVVRQRWNNFWIFFFFNLKSCSL